MNPWEMDFSVDREEPITETPPKAPEKPSKRLMPWEMDFSTVTNSKLRVEASRPLPEPSKEPSVDSVFANLIQAESRGKHVDSKGNLITSKVGAQGITQLMPSTASNPGFGIKPVQDQSEGEYLRVGKSYLSALYNKFKDLEKALAAYNAGMGNVAKAEGKAERYGGDWKDYLPKKQETLPYVEKVLREKK